MDKVKQIFKGDSDASTTRSSTGSSATPNSQQLGSTGTGVGGRTHTHDHDHDHTHNHSHGTTSTGTGATGAAANLANQATHDHRHQSEQASLPGHQHNIKDHSSLEGVRDATHDHKHLAAVTREKHHEHETEEVIREREHDRHIHHVQHHVQPVLDTQHRETQHATNAVPVTHIKEQHVNTDEDKKLFAGLGSQYRDQTIDGGKERTVVDKGEVVKENIAHHVHHVVQPVIERDTHHHKTIHTTIPVKHTTHEAPIVHQSSTHEPMKLSDFVAQGGDLKSNLTHHDAGVLATGDCARDVDGPAETLAEKLHLSSGSSSHSHKH